MTTTKAKGAKAKAVGYLRTSSAMNTGADKDSEKRQREAIEAHARSAGVTIVDWYYDAAVSGADPVDTRPGFTRMLERIAGNGVRLIIVETANRLARDLMVQETALQLLRRLGVEIVAADSPDSFTDDTPTAVLVRHILGAVAQFEKAALVAKLRGARDRASASRGRRVEGRPSMMSEEIEARIRSLARKPKGKRRSSLREVAAALAAEGVVNPATGKPFSHTAISTVIGPRPRDAERQRDDEQPRTDD